VLDVGHHPAEELRPVQDALSGVFLLEQVTEPQDLERLAAELEPLDVDAELEEDIALLMSSIIGKLTLKGKKVPPIRTFKEVHNMVVERAATWPEMWAREGREEGRKEGLEKGRKEGQKKGLEKGRKEGQKEGLRLGKVEMLSGLASHRFGKLPQWAVERLERADVETLDAWSRRLLDAKRLEDVFGD
jgi:hypothetical protein